MKNAFEYEAELVALRGELANAKEWSERLDKRCVALATDKDTLIDRCKAAEQRNADMLNWLRRQANAEKDPTMRATFIEAHNALKQIAREVRNDSV